MLSKKSQASRISYKLKQSLFLICLTAYSASFLRCYRSCLRFWSELCSFCWSLLLIFGDINYNWLLSQQQRMDPSPASDGLTIKKSQQQHLYSQIEDIDDENIYSPQNQVEGVSEHNVSHHHRSQEKQKKKRKQQSETKSQDAINIKRGSINKLARPYCSMRLNILIYSAIVLLFSLLIIHALAQSTQISFTSNTNTYTDGKKIQLKQNTNQIRQIEVSEGNSIKQVPQKQTQKQASVTIKKPSPPPNNPNKYSETLDLNDMSREQPYLSAPPDIKRIFDEMKARPPQKTSSPSQIFMPSEKAYFAYRLYKNPEREDYLRAEYYYYDMKYNISQNSIQTMLCIVAPGRNIVKEQKYKRFIDSIQRQNYSNYRLVYIDDASDDNSGRLLEAYVRQSKGKLSRIGDELSEYAGSFMVKDEAYKGDSEMRRLLIVVNHERLYALANRNQGIRNYCPASSVILDVDSDDAFIGNQAFKFVNAVYTNSSIWMMNSVFIYDKTGAREVTTGPQDGVPEEVLRTNSYRTSMVWKTSQLRTFRAQLFLKIDERDFKNREGKFYEWASDVFIQEPLVELAGLAHYKHIYEIVYFYDWNFDVSTVHKRRHYRNTVFMQTPYLPLPSLDSHPQKVKDYIVPQRIKEEYEKNIIQARKQATRFGRDPPF